ncbi:MAG: tetratricopeptide repeat protein [Candidatus Cryptobacteroides sp.]|jgi:tetratricopeptide (TPR) repeat protein
MKRKRIVAVVAAMVFCPGISLLAQDSAPETFRRAMDLYERGMFERAATLFGALYAETGDFVAKGYETLCSVRLQEPGNELLAAAYAFEYPYSSLIPQLHFYNALNLFDKEHYAEAASTFYKIERKDLYADQLPEYSFKKSYALFETGDIPAAKSGFELAEKMPQSDYTAPSRYSLGYINYSEKRFREAYDWFEKAARDPRFTDMSNYYMLECRFMRKDYGYVTGNGPELYERIPKERQPHLARIISESFLASGNTAKAREYYDRIERSRRDMDRNDFFYAGSLFYAVDDFPGAIDNYSLMKERTDSIGQIANYQLGYSYIQTGNKVAAMQAFKEASEQTYDLAIQEDAHFNYAKLSFDLNHNPTVFDDYIAKYSDKQKGDRIYSYMALSSLYNHDYAGAVEAYSHIDLLDDNQKANYMRANYLRAHQLIENGSWRDAIPCLRAAAYYSDRRETFNQLARYWLGEAYYRSEQFEQAVETFKDLYNISALDGKEEGNLIPYDLAYSYFRLEDYDNASKWFDQYLAAKNPLQGKDAAVRRADCDFIRKDYAIAIQKYEAATERFNYSDNLYPFYRAGIAYGLLGDRDKKVQALSGAEHADPSAAYYAEALYELGRAYVAVDRNDEAMDCFRKLSASTQDKSMIARSLIELGMIFRNLSEFNQALEYYKQVVQEMPETEYAENALLAIESIYQSQGRTDEYLDYAEAIGGVKGKTDSEKEEMYFNAAEQLYLTDHYSKSLTALQNYLERYPQGSKVGQASFYIAECYRNLGNKEQACDWYRQAIDRGSADSFTEIAMLNFSRLSYELERFQDAYGGYSSLLQAARLENNQHAARIGMMRSAYRGQEYAAAISGAEKVRADSKSSADELREADFVIAKSNLSTGERDKAFELFTRLSVDPATQEGAEAAFMLIQDAYDQGRYEEVEKKVYSFADAAGNQSYWLAKAFIVLGDSFAERDNYDQAKATFESILNGYQPVAGTADDVLDNVRMRLGKLQNLMNEK